MLERNTVRLHQSRHIQLLQGARLSSSVSRRRCEAADCDTLLSRYNPSTTCNVHQGWRDTRQRRYD